jgi:CheY-like chemotaxis protein
MPPPGWLIPRVLQGLRPPLVVYFEDDKLLGDMFTLKFQHCGTDVLHFSSLGADPVTVVHHIKPSLVIMSIVFSSDLSSIDGFEATRLLKANEKTRDIPVFGLSNLGQPKDIKRAKKVEMTDYWVSSKYKPHEVVKKVKQLLNLSHDDEKERLGP